MYESQMNEEHLPQPIRTQRSTGRHMSRGESRRSEQMFIPFIQERDAIGRLITKHQTDDAEHSTMMNMTSKTDRRSMKMRSSRTSGFNSSIRSMKQFDIVPNKQKIHHLQLQHTGKPASIPLSTLLNKDLGLTSTLYANRAEMAESKCNTDRFKVKPLVKDRQLMDYEYMQQQRKAYLAEAMRPMTTRDEMMMMRTASATSSPMKWSSASRFAPLQTGGIAPPIGHYNGNHNTMRKTAHAHRFKPPSTSKKSPEPKQDFLNIQEAFDTVRSKRVTTVEFSKVSRETGNWMNFSGGDGKPRRPRDYDMKRLENDFKFQNFLHHKYPDPLQIRHYQLGVKLKQYSRPQNQAEINEKRTKIIQANHVKDLNPFAEDG